MPVISFNGRFPAGMYKRLAKDIVYDNVMGILVMHYHMLRNFVFFLEGRREGCGRSNERHATCLGNKIPNVSS